MSSTELFYKKKPNLLLTYKNNSSIIKKIREVYHEIYIFMYTITSSSQQGFVTEQN